MAQTSDRNLLFGILALQLNFVTRDQLVQGMHDWVLSKDRPLGEIFVRNTSMTTDDQILLDALVDKHVEKHGSVEKSLQQLSSLDPRSNQLLSQIEDSAIRVSLNQVGVSSADPYATTPYSEVPTRSKGRFRIIRPHRRGGLGEVYVAEDLEISREVALKEIQEKYACDTNNRERFLREAEITGRLEHPSIVPVYGLGTYDDGRPFYAMKFVKGESLHDAILAFHERTTTKSSDSYIAGSAVVKLRELLGRFIDVCNAVHYAHSRGVLHRDLKPGNIMLGEYGETLVVDWGLAKTKTTMIHNADESLIEPRAGSGSAPTVLGRALGTPAFMSPEQAAGAHDQLDVSTDVYALGATLYFLLTGLAPFKGTSEEILELVQRGYFPVPTQVNRQVPKALSEICVKAMSLLPANRYSSAEELARDIERWMADEPVTAMRDPIIDSALRWSRHHKSLVAVALVLTLVVPIALGSILFIAAQKATAEAGRIQAEAEKAIANEKASSTEKLYKVTQYQSLIAAPTNDERGRFGWTWERQISLKNAAAIDVPTRNLTHLRSELAECLAAVDFKEASPDIQSLLVLEPASILQNFHSASRLAFSSDGRFLALAQSKTTAPMPYQVRIVDLEGGSARSVWIWPQLDADLVMKKESRYEGVRALVFTPDSSGLIVATRNGWIHHFDLSRTDEKPRSWKGHDGRVFGLAISPDGRWLVSADDNKLKRWDLHSNALAVPESVTREREDTPGDIFIGISSLPNKDSFICATVSGIRVLDYEAINRDAKKLFNDRGALAVSPCGWAVAAAVHNKVVMFDLDQKLDILSFLDPALQGETHVNGSIFLRFSHKGDMLLSSTTTDQDQVVKFWEVSTGRLLLNLTIDGSVNDAVFSPDGKWLAIATTEKNLIFEIHNDSFQTTVAHQAQPISAIEFDPTGRHMLSAAEPRTAQGLQCNASITLWETSKWQRAQYYEISDKARKDVVNACPCLAFQPDGNCFTASWPSDKQILIFNKLEEAGPTEIAAESSSGRIAFSEDASRLWSVGGEKVMQWSTLDWKQGNGWSNDASAVFTGATTVTCLSACKDYILVGARDGKIRKLTDTSDPQFMGIWTCFTGPVTSLSIDPANEVLGVGGNNGEIAVFQLPSGKLIARIENAHKGAVNSTSVSCDGHLLASASNDRTIKIWRVTQNMVEELLTLRPSARSVHSVRFSLDGTKLYSASFGETAVRVWDISELRRNLKQLQIDWE